MRPTLHFTVHPATAAKLRRKKEKKRSFANPEAASLAAPPTDAATAAPGAVEYTSEYLAELKKSTYSLAPPPKPREDAPTIRLTGLLKRSGLDPEDEGMFIPGPPPPAPPAYVTAPPPPPPPTKSDKVEDEAALDEDEDEDDDGIVSHAASLPLCNFLTLVRAGLSDDPSHSLPVCISQKARPAHPRTHPFTQIPDAETIKRIKEQRERRRAGGFASGADYVPVSMAAGGAAEGLGRARGVKGGAPRAAEEDAGPSDEDEDAEFEDRGKMKYVGWLDRASFVFLF